MDILFGVENRTIMDIDTVFRNVNFNEEIIINMIKEIIYRYKPVLGDYYVKLRAYNIETILSRVELNGRMRDGKVIKKI